MTEVKRGMLRYYHQGLFNKKWKEYTFILYDTSLLTWYTDNKHKKADGIVLLKNIERFICVGPYTRCLPDFPHLDNEIDQLKLIAFPMSIHNRDRNLVWLLCEDMHDLDSWMKAIIQTLSLYTFQTMTDIPIDLQSNFLSASLIRSCLQNSKINPLKKAGYNYGDTLWGTGEGWGCFSPLTLPGFFANHIDLTHYKDDEEVVYDVADSANDVHDDDDIDLEDDEDGIIPQGQETLEMIHSDG